MTGTTRESRPRRTGFTLVELLVVVVIIVLLTAAALPVVLPALSQRRVSEGARVVQAALAGARDGAIRANAPRGIRLLPDPDLAGNFLRTLPASRTPEDYRFAASRIVAIEPGPDYAEGRVSDPSAVRNLVPALYPYTLGFPPQGATYNSTFLRSQTPLAWDPRLTILEAQTQTYSLALPNVPNPPTSWFWNLRQGEKVRFNDAGRYYTIAGPIAGTGSYPNGDALLANAERFINDGAAVAAYYGPPGIPGVTAGTPRNEYLFLVNGQDDDGDGFVDESFDGIDNDGDGIIDPGFNGLDDDGDGTVDNPEELFYAGPGSPMAGLFSYGEWELETFVGSQFGVNMISKPYNVVRRPVVSEGAREVQLPAGVVIDMTTMGLPLNLGFFPERSRLPLDIASGYVEIMVDPTGQVINTSASANAAPDASLPFFHFWLCDREDVQPPLWGLTNGLPSSNPNSPAINRLPLPKTPSTPTGQVVLKGERRLVTLFPKTGKISSHTLENFVPSNPNAPYLDAQTGGRDEP